MAWNDIIVAAHVAACGNDTPAVSHSERLKSARYFVWQEDGADDLTADGAHEELAVTGRTDLYSQTELDPWASALGAAFDLYGILWSLVLCDYEEDTRTWHWSWDWTVI